MTGEQITRVLVRYALPHIERDIRHLERVVKSYNEIKIPAGEWEKELARLKADRYLLTAYMQTEQAGEQGSEEAE